MVCIICDHRPAKTGCICATCQSRIEADERNKNRKSKEKPIKFATYHGHVIGFYRNGGSLTPRLINRKPGGLPKRITLNLNNYLPGFQRSQIKKIKTAILQLVSS